MTSGDIFLGISSMSQLALAIAAGSASWIAYSQLSGWREEARHKTRAEVAKQLLIAVRNTSNFLRSLRSPLDQIPQDKLGDKTFLWKQRWNRVKSGNDYFGALQESVTNADILIGDPEISAHVGVLFSVRNEVIVSLEALIERPKDWNSDPDREFWLDQRRVVYGTYGERDEMGRKQLNAVEELESLLIPVARMKR